MFPLQKLTHTNSLVDIPDNFKKKSQFICNLKSFHSGFKTFPLRKPTWQDRLALRKNLVQELKHRFSLREPPEENRTVLNKAFNSLLLPGEKPESHLATISISHCTGLGGFVFSFDKDRLLGLDIEEISRINPQLLNRVSTRKELKEVPFKPFLWVAKEAGVKCFNSNGKVHFLSQCLISKWQRIGEKIYCFDFNLADSENRKGQGTAFFTTYQVLALCSIRQKEYS